MRSVLKLALVVAAVMAAQTARADEVTSEDFAPVGKPVLVPLVNMELQDRVEPIYLQGV